MKYEILENGVRINTIIADEAFAESYALKTGYTLELILEDPPEPVIDELTQIQLALAELAEAQAETQTQNELAMAELAELIIGG